jgi:hypothetical protein
MQRSIARRARSISARSRRWVFGNTVSKMIRRPGIEVAKARFEDFRERMDAKPKRPPRAAGHDAP